MKDNKGITLIVLIITIVILLILSVVSIELLLGDDRIISKTEGAKIQNSRLQIMDELESAAKISFDEFGEYKLEKAINNIRKNSDKIKEIVAEKNGRLGITIEEDGKELKYIISNKGNVIEVSEYSSYGDELSSVENVKVYELLVPIPKGFRKDENQGETNKIENGLIIVENNGTDQYIWIPVKEEDLNSILVANNDGQLFYYETIKNKYKIVEPYYISLENKVNLNGLNMELEEFNMLLAKNYNNAIKSIKKYGGFYISKEKQNIGDQNWLEYWSNQNDLKNKYEAKEEINTAMIYGFQIKMIEKFLETTRENLEYLRNSSVATQLALLNISGENSEFKYANLSFNSNNNNIESQTLNNGTYTVLYFK